MKNNEVLTMSRHLKHVDINFVKSYIRFTSERGEGWHRPPQYRLGSTLLKVVLPYKGIEELSVLKDFLIEEEITIEKFLLAKHTKNCYLIKGFVPTIDNRFEYKLNIFLNRIEKKQKIDLEVTRVPKYKLDDLSPLFDILGKYVTYCTKKEKIHLTPSYTNSIDDALRIGVKI